MHETFIRRTISLAERDRGRTAPSPLVGTVLVRGGKIIGEGFHTFYDGLHAERTALEDCFQRGLSPADVSLCVILEPYCHTGKRPPCTKAILTADIRAVFVGSSDSNPLVTGKSIAALRQGGIAVTEHTSGSAYGTLNAPFFHHIRTGLPFVLLKYAVTFDGKTACASGASRWIIGETVRKEIHRTHAAADVVVVGVDTVLQDDPLLTYRVPGGRNPLRAACDSGLRVPLDNTLVKTVIEVPTLLTCCVSDTARHGAYLAADCEILAFPGGRVDLRALLTSLDARGINEVLVEGGVELGWALLSADLMQHAQAYIAPKLFGGKSTPSALSGTGVPYPIDAFAFKNVHIRSFGADMRTEGDL